MDDAGCLQAFYDRYPLGEAKEGWVHPSDLSVLYTANAVKSGPRAAAIVMFVLAGVCSIGLLILACLHWKENRPPKVFPRALPAVTPETSTAPNPASENKLGAVTTATAEPFYIDL